MGKNWGMLKYILFAPVKRPVNYFKYGTGFAALFSAIHALGNSQRPFVDAFVAYFVTKYLPPLSGNDILVPIVLGAVFAGLKWRESQQW
jgi:hypothetical protein